MESRYRGILFLNGEPMERVFQDNFSLRGEVGASVAVWRDGVEAVSLAGGLREKGGNLPWEKDTLVPVWSATKGLSAAAFLLALDEAGKDLDEEVATVWEGLGSGAKAGLTFGQVLSHQAGLPALDEAVQIADHEGVVRALEGQVQAWRPGEGRHGYHPRTWGFIVDELLRRLTGARCLGEYWRERLAIPLGLDLWIGELTADVYGRVAPVYAGKPRPEGLGEDGPFYNAFGKVDSLTHRAFTSPRGLDGVSRFNDPSAWNMGLAAMGGLATASGLAKFYGILACGGEWGGERIFSERVMGWMETVLVDGDDLVFLRPTAFGAGMMKDPVDGVNGEKVRSIFGPSTRAFGHPGAGGSHGFADPERRMGFGYVMNQMELGILPKEKAMGLVGAVYGTQD
ncbi:MAG: serine hydrolase domain-containing protein [Verrucomicrobiota bacterium]